MEQQYPYLKKRVTAAKISRLKLQDEFACRGWNTCSPFETKSSESECDIIASPTKYPSSKKCNVHEHYSKKKPMLLEISNIESVFLQNRQKTSKLKNEIRLSETFYDFVPKLVRQEKLNVICHKKRAQNFHESSQNKKHCNEFAKHSNTSNIVVSNKRLIKENSPKKKAFVYLDSSDVSNIKNNHSQKITEEKIIKFNASLKLPNVSLSSLHIKNDQNKVLKTEFKKGITNMNSNSHENHSSFHSEISHMKCHIDTSLISNIPPIKQIHCSEKINLNNSKTFSNVLQNNCDKTVSSTILSDLDSQIYIQDESSSESHVSSIIPCSPVHSQAFYMNEKETIINDDSVKASPEAPDSSVLINIEDKSSQESSISPVLPSSPLHSQSCDMDKNEKRTNVNRKNNLFESHKLQDFQATFQLKKHELLMPPNSSIKLISDCSPIKEKNIEQDISLNTRNKFKILSETFVNVGIDVKNINNSGLNESIQNNHNPINVESEVILSTPKFESTFRDKLNYPVNESKVSRAQSTAINNKTFLKTIQSSFQEKSFTNNKGSNWMQTLNWDQFSESKSDEYEHDDQIAKKSLKNIIHGGFAEQMFKLQRRERSDRVIWNHKMNELKKKAATNLITFTLTSILNVGQIVMTKSTTTDINNEYLKDMLHNEDFHLNNEMMNPSCDALLPQPQSFIVLFKREMFTKMHLKVGDDFSLYPPWQFLSVPSLLLPVILCTYFMEPIIKDKESVQKDPSEIQSFPVLYKSLQARICECDEPVVSSDYLNNSSDLYGKFPCVSARIQRIWKTVVNNKFQNILKIHENSFTLLLQTQDAIFLELKINFSQLSDTYLEFLSNSEGKCFRFCNAVICHRYNLKLFRKLKLFIQYMQNNSSKDKVFPIQMFCYQLMPASFNKIPRYICDENFPPYYDYNIKPLSFLQKNSQTDLLRFSCIGKVVFQNNDDFYITDESLLCSKVKKYFLLKFETILKVSLIGAIVLIKEAIKDENYLFIDKFSSCEILSSSKSSKRSFTLESRIKKIGLITYDHLLSPLSFSSKMKDLVLMNGIISYVDENSAISWLECSFCSGENLLEDSNSVIYCEDCACIVPKPVLKVKMEVIVQNSCLSSAKAKIQLLSSTVKKILKISEDDYQPECNISDVLRKSTGTLCCFLKNIEVLDELKIFHLTEIKSC